MEETKSNTEIDTQTTNNDVLDSNDQITEDKSELIEIEGNIYSEYYPGKRDLKFQGPQDDTGQRHGKWLYFAETGEELSMTMYNHGKKHGHTIVKYPNGAIHYVGEWRENEQVGEWKTYTIEGKLHEVKNFGYPEN
jgi:antitoxin component YwqK of YwqJK toxin-antitoxin module